MTRVLYWNIENFGINKIYNPNTRKRKTGSSLKEADAANERLAEINTVLTAANPQVIVVVEVESAPFNGFGLLGTGAGTLGALGLQIVAQNALGGNWALVPPLQTGPTEAVAVLYETTNRFFAGPYVWPGGVGPAIAPGGGTGAYPGPMAAWLPAAAVPAGALQNVGTAQNLCAARASGFTHRAAHPTNPGAPWAFRWFERAPYQVSLFESAGAGRNLTIFGIHAPSGGGGGQYLQDLSDIAEIVDNVGANEVRLVIGDFNVQLLTGTLAEDPAYGHLQARGYTLALAPLAPAPVAPAGYATYYATHIRGQFKAKCWPRGGAATDYPGYRYVGADHGPPAAAIDNAFFHYGAGIVAPGPANFTIMNRVVGSPMNSIAPPSGGAPPGAAALGRGTTVPPPAIAPAVGPAYNGGLKTSFQSWAEYGRIRSTSDHFALVIDV